MSVTVKVRLAVTRALAQNPLLNCHWVDGEIHQFRAVNILIAIATPNGLVAPVIPGVEDREPEWIVTAMRDLRERAHAQRLRTGDLEDGTFTVSNLGALGVEEFVALVTPPQVAALAVGAPGLIGPTVADALR